MDTLKIGELIVAKYDRENKVMYAATTWALSLSATRKFYKFMRECAGSPNMEISQKDIEDSFEGHYLFGFEMRKRNFALFGDYEEEKKS